MAKRKTNNSNDTKDRGRWSSKKKSDAVLRLLRGEELDALSRELGVTAAMLSSWRDDFLAAGTAGLKTREPTVQDEEVLKLKAMIGDLTMRNELLRERSRAAEAERPLAWRKTDPRSFDFHRPSIWRGESVF
jgi:hypothetical protein